LRFGGTNKLRKRTRRGRKMCDAVENVADEGETVVKGTMWGGGENTADEDGAVMERTGGDAVENVADEGETVVKGTMWGGGENTADEDGAVMKGTMWGGGENTADKDGAAMERTGGDAVENVADEDKRTMKRGRGEYGGRGGMVGVGVVVGVVMRVMVDVAREMGMNGMAEWVVGVGVGMMVVGVVGSIWRRCGGG